MVHLSQLYEEKGELFFEDIYNEHRGMFIPWAVRQFNVSKSDAVEIFQESVVTLFMKIENGELTRIESSIRTFLFGVAKNKLLNANKKKSTHLQLQAQMSIENTVPLSYQETDHDLSLQLRLKLKQLGDRCQKLLRLFYFNQFSTEVIAHRMSYENSNVVKAQKYKCLRQLKALMQKPKNHE